MNDQKDVVNVSTLDLFKVYKENHSKLIYLSKRLENIELTIEKYPYQSGLSSRTTNRIDSLRKLNSIYEDEMVFRIDKLKNATQARVVEQYAIYQLSFKSISKELGYSERHIKRIYYDALKKM